MTRSVLTALLLASAISMPALATVGQEKVAPAITLSNDPSAPVPALPLKAGQKVPASVATQAPVKTAANPAEARTPCITAQDDGTGEILKFSGGGGVLNGLSVQSRKLSLKPDSAVPVTLSFDRASAPVRLTGYAPSETLVIVNTTQFKTLYPIAQQSGVLTVRVGGQGPATELVYPLEGITTALADMELCYQGKPARLAQPAGRAPVKQEEIAAAPPVAVDTADLEYDGEPAAASEETEVSETTEPDESEVDLGSLEISDAPFAPPAVPTPEDVVADMEPSLAVSEEDIPVIKMPAPLPEKDVAPVPAPAGPQAAPSPAVSKPVGAQETTLTFRARKGEPIRDVMRRWADRAGVDLVWNTPDDVELKKDFSYFGTFKGAVDALVKDYPDARMNTAFVNPPTAFPEKPYIAQTTDAPPAAPTTIPGNDLRDFVPTPPPEMAEPSAPAKSPPAPMADAAGVSPLHRPVLPPETQKPIPAAVAAPAVAAEPAKPFGPTRRWRALQGASLKQVMQAWAEDAGVTLVWQSRQDYALPLSVNMSADYGRAVTYVLEQYRFEGARPIGQIYNDPAGDKKVLVIRSGQG